MVTNGCSDAGVRWHCNTPADYAAACFRREHRARLETDSQRGALVKRLAFDTRATVARGLALVHTPRPPPPPHGNCPQLHPDDRLEQDDVLRDVGSLEDIVTPATVTCGRRPSETIARHRSPSCSDALGISMM